ncbi:MAG: isocitrate/isopropylmalate dehydrogenase family protein [bacterium JZ-2024 1]
MAYNVVRIPGDGVGPEIMEATMEVLDATGVPINWEEHNVGEEVMKEKGTPLPEETVEAIKRVGVALKGPVTTPIGTGFRSVNVALRKALNLYANVRPAYWFEGVLSPYRGIDLVVIRENLEDLYSGVEYYMDENTAVSLKIITRRNSERIIRFAFEYARKEKRKKVTAVTKANILKYTDGLFFEIARQVAKEYPDIVYEERLVDNMAMQLVQKPQLYDVLVLPNLYGDILSDLCAGLVGGLGMAPSGNFGETGVIFEAVHGSAPKYKGMRKVNPTALILSAAMMLKYLGEKEAAERVRRAVAQTIREGKKVTYDLIPPGDGRQPCSTDEMAKEIAFYVRKGI